MTQENGRERQPLFRRLLIVLLPTLAALLAAGFVLVCVSCLVIRPFVAIELGSITPQAEAFVRSGAKDVSYAVEPAERYAKAGNYWVKVRCGSFARAALLLVRDTVAPQADAVETTVSTKETLSPDRLVKNLKDQSILKLTYTEKPDYGTVGDYTAIVKIEDQSGNSKELSVPVHVRIARDSLTAEAGEPALSLDAFLLDSYDAAFLTPITETVMTTPGSYPIRIAADGVETESTLIVLDTVAPHAIAKTCVAAPGAAVRPEDLLSELSDATSVTVSFVEEPDFASREPQTISVKLVDLGGNETVVTSTLLFSGVSPVLIEASDKALNASELPLSGSGTVSLPEPFVPNVIGTHLIPVLIDGEENLAVIEVQDTEAPTVTVVSDAWYLNEPQDTDRFVTVSDATETETSYSQEPDWTKESQQVTITSVDAGGNRTEVTFTLTLVSDVVPPTLYGVRNRYCYRNEAVAYLMDVSADDNCDGAVEVKVDASKVDPQKVGVYPVTYTAIDRAGNTTQKTVQFSVVEPKVTEERAEEVAQEILSKILTDGMTIHEQIKAIYDYVFYNVHYVSRSDKKDWRSEAVRGLTTGYGDCFTSYSSARLLMEHTDAQILSVERVGVGTRHYWLLVNVGTGWYHFDACNAGSGKKRCFMWTNAQTTAVSWRFWHYDQSLYPPVATERYKGGD